MIMQEKIEEFGQGIFLAAQVTNGIGNIEKAAWFENVTTMNKLDALVIPRPDIASFLTIGGFQESMFLQDMIMKVFLSALILEDWRVQSQSSLRLPMALSKATLIWKPPSFKPKSLK